MSPVCLDGWLSVADTARELEVSRQAVHKMIKAKKLTPSRIGRSLALPSKEVLDLKALRKKA